MLKLVRHHQNYSGEWEQLCDTDIVNCDILGSSACMFHTRVSVPDRHVILIVFFGSLDVDVREG